MSFLGEIKQRKVFQVAIAYVIAAWLIAQVVDVINELLHLPGWFDAAVLVSLGLGFPLALILSWVYELTPDGLERTEAVAEGESITPATGTKLNCAIIGLLIVAVTFKFVDNYMLNAPRPPLAGAVVDPASLETQLSEPPVATATVAPPPLATDTAQELLPNSVAVLPFESLSVDSDPRWIEARSLIGVSDE